MSSLASSKLPPFSPFIILSNMFIMTKLKRDISGRYISGFSSYSLVSYLAFFIKLIGKNMYNNFPKIILLSTSKYFLMFGEKSTFYSLLQFSNFCNYYCVMSKPICVKGLFAIFDKLLSIVDKFRRPPICLFSYYKFCSPFSPSFSFSLFLLNGLFLICFGCFIYYSF